MFIRVKNVSDFNGSCWEYLEVFRAVYFVLFLLFFLIFKVVYICLEELIKLVTQICVANVRKCPVLFVWTCFRRAESVKSKISV